jgi:hypothetical protein
MGDRDTHRGQCPGVTRSVHSLCGLEFQPVALPYGGFFLPGTPPDPGIAEYQSDDGDALTT